jgi:hypothetical protein
MSIETDIKSSKPIIKENKNIEDNIEIESTGSSAKEKVLEEPERVNERFFLRKRRNVSYNLKTKKFEYECGSSDSDYEEKPKHRGGKK